MGRKATKTLPVRPETKQLVDERKPEGVTYDHWVRQLLGVE
jgi:hypothetical protein